MTNYYSWKVDEDTVIEDFDWAIEAAEGIAKSLAGAQNSPEGGHDKERWLNMAKDIYDDLYDSLSWRADFTASDVFPVICEAFAETCRALGITPIPDFAKLNLKTEYIPTYEPGMSFAQIARGEGRDF